MNIRSLISGMILLFIAGTLSAQTTSFTYQGSLSNGGSAANGNHDFEFVLFNALAGGSQLGTTVTRSSVAVGNGVFSVSLDFGNQFPGDNRFLEIRVRPSGGGAFTPLAPRQPVNSAPYSIKSLGAESAVNALTATNALTAANATNATQLGGIPASQYVVSGTQINMVGLLTKDNGINSPNVTGGSTHNNVNSGIIGGTIGGGGDFDFPNSVTANFGTVGGGHGNRASGSNATVPGGFFNRASGNFSFAAGRRAKADHQGTFVWADTTDADFISTAANQFVIRATGGVGIGSTAPARPLHVANGSAGSISPHANTLVVLERSGATYIQMFSPDADESGLFFGKPSLNIKAALIASPTNGLQFRAGGNTTRMTLDAAGNFGIGTLAPNDRLDVNGTIRIATLGTGGATGLCRNPSNQIATCSSSGRYKSNVSRFGSGLSLIRQLRPVSFNWRDGGTLDLGLVAEDVAKVEPLLVTTNDKGDVEGVKYDRIGVVLINAVKEQQSQIQSQADLIKRQQQRIDELTKLVCATNPSAEICAAEMRKEKR